MEFITAEQLREYLHLDADSNDERYGDAQLGSNIRAASSFLQRITRRQFERQTATTKRFTTNGKANVLIPDLETATSVSLQEAAQTANETYWLISDSVRPDRYTSIQLRPFGSYDYRSNPQWFDRNLDRDYRRGWPAGSLPNDLVITGNWGYTPSEYPEDLLMATKILAAWYTRRPESVLANVRITPEGSELRYGDLPPEVRQFIKDWQLAENVAVLN